jgi:hypothetical protein
MAMGLTAALMLGPNTACGDDPYDPYEQAAPVETQAEDREIPLGDAQGQVSDAFEKANISPLDENGRRFESPADEQGVEDLVDRINKDLANRFPAGLGEAIGSCSLFLYVVDGGNVRESTLESISFNFPAGNYGQVAKDCKSANVQAWDGPHSALYYGVVMP